MSERFMPPGLQPEGKEREKRPYDAIVVMPYSSAERLGGRKSKVNQEGDDFGLTYESKLANLAAAQAFKEGKADKIILVGEDTVGSEKKYSTVDFMKELLVAKGVPETAIEAYKDSQNSIAQLTKVSEVQKPEEKYLIVSLAFHQPRVKIIAKNTKVQAEHVKAEDLLLSRSKHFKRPIREWAWSKDILKARGVEVVLSALNLTIDKDGSIQNWLTSKLGTRQRLTDFPRTGKGKKTS